MTADIEIRELTPELAEDYVNFFDRTPHDEDIAENKCYCVTWRGDASLKGGDHWYPTREERREHALGFVRDGSLQGYLAYESGKIVGWCNATAECQTGVDYLRAYWPIEGYDPKIKVKSIFCFVIAPEMRRKGLATRFVERACRDAAGEGFDYVEAYANKEHTAFDFRGPLGMYEKCGFVKSEERDGKITVRKALKPVFQPSARL